VALVLSRDSIHLASASIPLRSSSLNRHGRSRLCHHAAYRNLAIHSSRYASCFYHVVEMWKLTCPLYSVDDDDLDENDIPGFTHPSMSPQTDKGKSRARQPEQLAAPSGSAGGSSSPGLSGNIGSSGDTNRPNRRTVGGVQVETRCVMYAHCMLAYIPIDCSPDIRVLIPWMNPLPPPS